MATEGSRYVKVRRLTVSPNPNLREELYNLLLDRGAGRGTAIKAIAPSTVRTEKNWMRWLSFAEMDKYLVDYIEGI